MIKYVVKYVDDVNVKHIAFAKSMAEVKFYQDRFTEVSFDFLKNF